MRTLFPNRLDRPTEVSNYYRMNLKEPSRAFFSTAAGPVLLTLLFGCGLEKGSIYFPDRSIRNIPSDIGLSYEDLYFDTSDGVRINGWFVPHPKGDTTLLWFHGNSGNLGGRIIPIEKFHRHLKVNILAIDYRGYGRSEGTLSEEGTYLDAVGAYDYLTTRPDIDAGRIIVFGRSLGTAVAVELATRRNPYGLILEAPFSSVRDMARKTFPWLPIGSFLKIHYDSLSKMPQLKVPLLVLHGDQDNIVPYTQGRRVFEAAPEPKTFYTIQGAGHNNTHRKGGGEYFRTISGFIEKLGAGTKLH